MNYIGSNDVPLSSKDIETIEKRIFIFDTEAEDYFLQMCISWDKVTTTFYRVKIGDSIYEIPSGTYLLCGCAGGSQDWIEIDELAGRPIEVILISKNFRSWDFVTPKFIAAREDSCYVPMVKNPIPVSDLDGGKHIIISAGDQYRKLKDRDYDIFFV